jgi:hypothetical protein
MTSDIALRRIGRVLVVDLDVVRRSYHTTR